MTDGFDSDGRPTIKTLMFVTMKQGDLLEQVVDNLRKATTALELMDKKMRELESWIGVLENAITEGSLQ